MAHTHTHDNIDWPTRLASLRRADDLDAEYDRQAANRLVGFLGAGAAAAPVAVTSATAAAVGGGPVIVDVGSGGGGMSAAFASALAARGGGRVVLSDAVGELLDAATAHVRDVAAGTPVVVDAVQADASSEQLADQLPPVDLVWASRVVHHLPDQQRAIDELARVLAPGGWLALGEGGLATKCLPWDLGIGDPGLGSRLTAARDHWFVGMRAGMPGVKSLPVGWNKALEAAGLTGVSSFSYVIDHPAPASDAVRQSVVDWLAWMYGVGEDQLSDTDRETVARLLDPADEAYLGARDDVYILGASTVYFGQKPR
jgi:SAM-dependent methyltransferase